MLLVAANQEIYNLLRDGIAVEFDNAKGQKQQERVRVIDFNRPDENRHHLPESYDRIVFTEKCNGVFDLMLNYASQGLKWAA